MYLIAADFQTSYFFTFSCFVVRKDLGNENQVFGISNPCFLQTFRRNQSSIRYPKSTRSGPTPTAV